MPDIKTDIQRDIRLGILPFTGYPACFRKDTGYIAMGRILSVIPDRIYDLILSTFMIINYDNLSASKLQ